ncbi:MAG: group 1 glycosyl transferase, partial [Flavobacterium sp.]
MKIGYITLYNSSDLSKWSGLGYYIASALKRENNELHYIDLSKEKGTGIIVKKRFDKIVYDNIYAQRNEQFLRKTSFYVFEAAKRLDVDCYFSPSSLPIAYFETNKPKIFYADATFANLINYYEKFKGLSIKTIDEGHKIEKQALDTCSIAIYSSEWAAKTAIEFYGADSKKVKVVPFGTNLDVQNTIKDILMQTEIF